MGFPGLVNGRLEPQIVQIKNTLDVPVMFCKANMRQSWASD
jgi:hypothetical protein